MLSTLLAVHWAQDLQLAPGTCSWLGHSLIPTFASSSGAAGAAAAAAAVDAHAAAVATGGVLARRG